MNTVEGENQGKFGMFAGLKITIEARRENAQSFRLKKTTVSAQCISKLNNAPGRAGNERGIGKSIEICKKLSIQKISEIS